jgi:hypothetical protein
LSLWFRMLVMLGTPEHLTSGLLRAPQVSEHVS